MARLTPKQAAFIGFYLGDARGNATRAAELAGYSKKTAYAIGAENLRKPQISEAIASRQGELAAELEVTQERIARELALLGFSNMLDYMSIGGRGEPFIDMSELTREQAAALTEATIEDYLEGRGDDAREVRRVRIKLADKRQSLTDLAKLLGLVEPKRTEITGKDGGPIHTSSIDTSKLSTATLRGIKRDLAKAAAADAS
jgi:phage terminase small subunit